MDTQEPTLRHGDEGIDGWVEYLQGLLIIEGHDTVTKNGSFDDATLDAVQRYQLHNGLVGRRGGRQPDMGLAPPR